MRLLLFNPETEYALASGASFYTPPANVDRMRSRLQLLPEAWAEAGDFILVDDPGSLSSAFPLVGWQDLEALFESRPDIVFEPWGWNPALVRRLRDAGVPRNRLPDDTFISRIRKLAHRRTTVSLNSLWNEAVEEEFRVDMPVEFTVEEDCMDYLRSVTGCWFKAPWSSSGRGVINTAADMTSEQVRQWCHGIIRRQGSVMAETPAKRVADFASEWIIDKNGEPRFLGLSCFSTSNRGKYISNAYLSQSEMRSRFDSLSKIPAEEVISIQKHILRRVLSGYCGPCGVDMLIETDGHLRPFVELNLRRTMGMLHERMSFV